MDGNDNVGHKATEGTNKAYTPLAYQIVHSIACEGSQCVAEEGSKKYKGNDSVVNVVVWSELPDRQFALASSHAQD